MLKKGALQLPQILSLPKIKLHIHYAFWTHKTQKIRYIEHISYTRFNNPQVAYTVRTLINCHEYDPVDEIMGLDQHFTKWSLMNASENFRI